MATTKKKYSTVEENLARRKYYNGTRPVATTSMGMGPVYIDTGDGKKADSYTPSQVHTFNLKGNSSTANNTSSSAPEVPKLDTSNKPTYTPQGAFDYKSAYEYKPFEYQSTYTPGTFIAPEAYQHQNFVAPAAYKAPDYNSYMSGNYDVGDFKSDWSDKLQSLYNEIAGRGKFSYNQAEDPLYQQYAEMYRRNAQLAMNDTVAKASALTGGYGSSYAETAGQSMYNQTMDNLNERALDLYDRALNAWALEGNELNQQFNLAGQMYNNDYNAWRAKMQDAQFNKQFDYNRYLNDREFGYNKWANDYANAWNRYQYVDQMGYQQYRDQVNDAWDQFKYADQMNYQRDQDAYNRARSAYEYDQNMRYQMDQDAYNRAWNQYQYAGDEAHWAYEQANNDWRYANDYALDVYDRNYGAYRDTIKDNQWQQEFDWNVGRDARDYARGVFESDRDFAWGQETYNRDDAFRQAEAAERIREWKAELQRGLTNDSFEQWATKKGIELDERQLKNSEKQQAFNNGLNAYEAGYDPVTGGMSAEAKARQDAADRFNYWQAGYDPVTGGYTKDAQSRYSDSLALDYAKLGMNPDGTLNAIGQMERDKIDAKAGSGAAKALAGYTANANQIINQGNIPTREQFEAAKKYYGPNQYGVMGDKGGQVEGKYYKKYDDYVDALLDSMSGATEEERQYILWYYTGKEKK